MKTAVDRWVDPAQQLIALSTASLDFAVQHSALYDLIFGLGVEVPHINPEEPQMQALLDVFNNVGKKLTGGEDSYQFMDRWWCLVHGFIALRRKPNTKPGPRSYAILEDYVRQSFLKT